jgi:hypothetical protein
MTNIRFDKQIRWRPVSAWLADDHGRAYAAPENYLISLVITPEAAEKMEDIPFCLYRSTFDCNIATITHADKPEEVLPRFAGYDYMRITVLGYASADDPHTTLSRLLEEAPKEEVTHQMRPKLVQGLTPVTVRLPKVLLDSLDRGAERSRTDRNTYLWTVLMEHAIDFL